MEEVLMEFLQFTKAVEKGLTEYFGKETEVTLTPVRKNNGVILTGIVIMEKGSHIAPTIYLEGFYEEYRNGKKLGEIVLKIIQIYERSRIEKGGNMEFFKEYDKVHKKIYYKLINAGKNKELLNEVPYIPYLDLAIVFYYDCSNELFGNAAILIKNSHLKMWGVDVYELYKEAVVNTPKNNPYEIKTMEEVMKEILIADMKGELERAMKKETGSESIPLSDECMNRLAGQMLRQMDDTENQTPMYVLSNTDRVHGAACILYGHLLEDFSKKINDNLYVLPSSVHEMIIIPASFAGKTSELKMMVEEINETQVEEEEVLSNSVYFFNRSTKKLEMA